MLIPLNKFGKTKFMYQILIGSFYLSLVSEQNCLAGSPQVELATTGRPYAALTKSGTHAIGFFNFSSKHLSSMSLLVLLPELPLEDDDDGGACTGPAPLSAGLNLSPLSSKALLEAAKAPDAE